MIEMTQDRGVELAHAQFREAQTAFDKAKVQLDGALIIAFSRLADVRQGDRIRVKVGFDRYVEGRAVIMRNDTRMGLYVETRVGHPNRCERLAVAEPYADHVHLLPKKKAPAKAEVRW